MGGGEKEKEKKVEKSRSRIDDLSTPPSLSWKVRGER